MTSKDFPCHPVSDDITFTVVKSSLGALLVAQSRAGICAVWMGDSAQKLADQFQKYIPFSRFSDDGAMQSVAETVSGLVETPSQNVILPLDVRGTPFQRKVWSALRAIPVGQAQSYAQVASRIGAPGSARAVAKACAANNLGLVVPCHRVIRADGGISGYRWGVDRKRKLLGMEAESIVTITGNSALQSSLR